jgi:hypothetical protein
MTSILWRQVWRRAAISLKLSAAINNRSAWAARVTKTNYHSGIALIEPNMDPNSLSVCQTYSRSGARSSMKKLPGSGVVSTMLILLLISIRGRRSFRVRRSGQFESPTTANRPPSRISGVKQLGFQQQWSCKGFKWCRLVKSVKIPVYGDINGVSSYLEMSRFNCPKRLLRETDV